MTVGTAFISIQFTNSYNLQYRPILTSVAAKRKANSVVLEAEVYCSRLTNIQYQHATHVRTL